MTAPSPLTPGQTVGPFLAIGLDWGELGACAADPNMDGVIRVGGRLLDGQGEPVGDGLIETWQVRPDGFARCLTDSDGAWEVVTRIYFANEAEANAADPVLASVDDDARSTLVAVSDDEGRYRLDIHLSGEAETVFFRV